jgi:DNA-3-methyladenine glycosylase I
MDDTVKRCSWVQGQPGIYVKYHDEEWGVPVHDDRLLFQKLVLDGAQAGLSWLTILKKRQAYTEAFNLFDFYKVAGYDECDIERLMGNPGIVRNKRKIQSAVENAKVFIKIKEEFGSFDSYLWGYVDNKPISNGFNDFSKIPAKTDLSTIISKDLTKRGMSFAGPVIIYAYMQAIGMVNDHTANCFRYNEILNICE